MSFEDNFGITKIKKGKYNNLVISKDYDINPKKTYPVLLFTPDMGDTNTHYHIALTKNQTIELRNWLSSFIKESKKGSKNGRRK